MTAAGESASTLAIGRQLRVLPDQLSHGGAFQHSGRRTTVPARARRSSGRFGSSRPRSAAGQTDKPKKLVVRIRNVLSTSSPRQNRTIVCGSRLSKALSKEPVRELRKSRSHEGESALQHCVSPGKGEVGARVSQTCVGQERAGMNVMRVVPAITCFAFAALMSGCGVVSRDGPASLEVLGNAEVRLTDTGSRLSYALVDLSPATVDLFASEPQRFSAFGRRYAAGGPAQVRIGVGDIVSVSIFEAAGGGLFLPEASRAGSAALPPQQVDRSGNLTVPYAGSVRAAGRTATEVQNEIEDKLKSRAIEPQVVVSIVDQRSNQITVLGEVGAPTKIPVEPAGTRLLSALARAGGAKNPAFETIITIQRGGRTENAVLSAVVTDPSQNIFLAGGDVVYASRVPRAFLALGATASTAVGVIGSNNRRFVFEQENLTLADGVAKAGGLIDTRADPSAVFLYRMVAKKSLNRAGVDVSRFPEPVIPTIFRVDLSRAEGLFIASNFFMQDKDIIFVSNSPAEDLNKFLTLINNISSTINSVRAIGNSTGSSVLVQ